MIAPRYTVDLISLLGPNATQGANKDVKSSKGLTPGGVNLVSSVKLLKTAELENVKCLLQSQLEESAIELEEKQDSDPSLSSETLEGIKTNPYVFAHSQNHCITMWSMSPIIDTGPVTMKILLEKMFQKYLPQTLGYAQFFAVIANDEGGGKDEN
ncbi:hypothetical protein K435DRAFT_800209 [Dendrothele bispora CBS 962.96]|uniref:Uncharacterized protein n=1 Tax=Dendrothele bispora (strain CBS 962.96) TaxID=1314807 RepID=A0A4S8LTB9_DENBC|nr:hypothetical protein K435DRAFT_800209 [Dendrothele bispora CBS 962.96]